MLLLTFFLIIVLFTLFLQSPTFKGIIGSSLISHEIHNKLDNNEYYLIKEIAMPALGDKTQIEEIIVSRFGIFVIETKYMKGWIYGDEKRKEWTQKSPGRKFAFQNPLHQNTNHIRALAHMLHLTDDKFHSLIVFTGKSTFKSAMPSNVLQNNYIDYIKSKDTEVFTKIEVEDYIKKINRFKMDRSNSASKQQIAYLRQPYRT